MWLAKVSKAFKKISHRKPEKLEQFGGSIYSISQVSQSIDLRFLFISLVGFLISICSLKRPLQWCFMMRLQLKSIGTLHRCSTFGNIKFCLMLDFHYFLAGDSLIVFHLQVFAVWWAEFSIIPLLLALPEEAPLFPHIRSLLCTHMVLHTYVECRNHKGEKKLDICLSVTGLIHIIWLFLEILIFWWTTWPYSSLWLKKFYCIYTEYFS